MKRPRVLGKFIYLDIPLRPETKIQVDSNTKEELEREWIAKLSKLQVWAKGTAVTNDINVGDWVLMDPNAINSIKMIPFDDGITRALVLDYHIVHIWDNDE